MIRCCSYILPAPLARPVCGPTQDTVPVRAWAPTPSSVAPGRSAPQLCCNMPSDGLALNLSGGGADGRPRSRPYYPVPSRPSRPVPSPCPTRARRGAQTAPACTLHVHTEQVCPRELGAPGARLG